jgi:hypothetical protein
MALCTQAEIERYSGFKASDFTQNGLVMEDAEWSDFVAMLIPRVTQMMQRYCNVYSFEPTTWTEYHNGKGATNFDSSVSDYNEEDQVFFLQQLYLNDDSLLIYEDTAAKSGVPTWCLRTQRPAGSAAEIDTIVIVNGPVTSGNITITLNNVTTYTVALTAGMTITQVCNAIVAAGAHTDSKGIVWTPTTTVPYVSLTAGTAGPANQATLSTGVTGLGYQIYAARKGTNYSGGDYEVFFENEVSRVMFYSNVPAKGNRNIKMIYNTGYALISPQLGDIKFQCIRACNNVLLTKKKIQEAISVRNYGVRDYSQMFDVFSEGIVLDDRIKASLEQYQRKVIPGQFAYD